MSTVHYDEMLPIGARQDDEEICHFIVVDLASDNILGCSKSCSFLFGLYPNMFKKLQEFELKASMLFPAYKEVTQKCFTSRYESNFI